MSGSNDSRDSRDFYGAYSSGRPRPRTGSAHGSQAGRGPSQDAGQAGSDGYGPPGYGPPGYTPPATGYGSPAGPAYGTITPGSQGQPQYPQSPQYPYGQPPYGWNAPAPANAPAQNPQNSPNPYGPNPYGPNPYGQYGQYGQWAPQPQQSSAPSYPASAKTDSRSYSPSREARKSAAGVMTQPAAQGLAGISRRTILIAAGAVAVVLVLIVAGVGGVMAYGDYQAPAGAGQQFCADLQTQSYDQAYRLFSASLRAQMTSPRFVAAAKALDQVEGKITACVADTAGGYNHALFSKTASAAYSVTRQHTGPAEGNLQLKSEAGSWRVSGLDVGMLGASLGAVIAVNNYCAALTGQRYADAYALLGAQMQTATQKDDFTQVGAWHDQLDGQMIVCVLTGVGAGASDSAATMSITATRTLRGVLQGALKLAPEGGVWKITDVAASLQGTDIAPLHAALRFCGDLATGNYADIYSMATKTYLNGENQAQLAADLSGKAFGVKWASCTLLDLSGYKLQGTKAFVNIEYTATQVSTGFSWKPQGTLSFVNQGDTWLLNSREGLH